MAIPSPYATFAAGILTAFTPCCLPVLPPLLSGSVGHRLRPVAIVAGSVLSFTAIGVVTGYLGMLAPETLRAPAFVTVIVFVVVGFHSSEPVPLVLAFVVDPERTRVSREMHNIRLLRLPTLLAGNHGLTDNRSRGLFHQALPHTVCDIKFPGLAFSSLRSFHAGR